MILLLFRLEHVLSYSLEYSPLIVIMAAPQWSARPCIASHIHTCGSDQASSGRWTSLKVGTLVEFHSAMTCPQTTHFAALLLSLEGREYVTA